MVVKRKRRKSSTRKRRPRLTAAQRRRIARRERFFKHVADAGVFCVTIAIGIAALFVLVARDLPDTQAIWRDSDGPKITLLAADGAPLVMNGASAGAPIRLAELPVHVPRAILAVEDRNFYHHFGINPVSVARAAFVNVRQGGVVQGGSTITQQLAKNVFLGSERTVKRKVQELILALWLERKFTKDEILTLYLNRVYFGAGAYGIDAASYRYFGKASRYLSAGEAAVLAGLLKAPSRLAPTSNPVDAGKRGRLVIEMMVNAGFLARADADNAIAQPILLTGVQLSAAPYFIDYAIAQAREKIGRPDADLIIKTTLDRAVQVAAETGFAAGLDAGNDAVSSAQGALVVMDNTGAVRAMVGGRDYASSQFNRATHALRQPGSAFKPFVFLAALENGVTLATRVDDAPIRIGSWAPDNYNSKFYGEVSLRQAMALSLNGATIRVQEAVSRSEVRRVAQQAGWQSNLTRGPSLALGVDATTPLGLATVYAPFSNGGFRVKPHVIASIETSDGEVLYTQPASFDERSARHTSIEAIDQMMQGVVSWGTGTNAQLPGYNGAGKTGTSQDSRDAWFAGYAGGLIGVVWIGRDDNKPMPGVTGGGTPAIIWREVMTRALPSGLVAPVQPVLVSEETDRAF